jgi:hypothetical protein
LGQSEARQTFAMIIWQRCSIIATIIQPLLQLAPEKLTAEKVCKIVEMAT